MFQLFLDSKRAGSFDGRHPWVLQNSLVEPTMPLQAGQVVELLQANGRWIGRGVYNPHSRIRLRLYQWDREQSLDEAWLESQLEAAVAMREFWMQSHRELDAVRLVNSEGDGLSGLIVDRFGDYLMVQLTSLAMWQWRQFIIEWLSRRLRLAGIHVGMDRQVAKQEGLEACDDWTVGEPPTTPIELEDDGVKLLVDVTAGQKTGYYLDQRDNRIAAAKWMRPGSLLDVCSYHGGFSLAGCRLARLSTVIAVDTSEKALAVAKQNAGRNGFSQIQFLQADCFDALQEWVNEGRRFDNIVLDPPRMAGSRHQISAALRAYHRLNLSALRLLVPGGTLVTCSCSGRVSREDFWGVLASASKRSRRRVQVVEMRTADFDHPVDVNCPESDYLKCFICRVE